jgi:hypothetical protein
VEVQLKLDLFGRREEIPWGVDTNLWCMESGVYWYIAKKRKLSKTRNRKLPEAVSHGQLWPMPWQRNMAWEKFCYFFYTGIGVEIKAVRDFFVSSFVPIAPTCV